MAFKKLIYSSRRLNRDAEALDSILTVSQQNNRRDGITGVLLHDDRRFVQFLEGDHDALARCFLRIAMSDAHQDIAVGALADSEVRLFMGWDMRGISAARARPSLGTLWRRVLAEAPEHRLALFEEALFTLLPMR